MMNTWNVLQFYQLYLTKLLGSRQEYNKEPITSNSVFEWFQGMASWGSKKKKKNLQKAVKNLIMGFMWNIPIENLRLVGTRDSKNVLCSIEMTWLLRAIVWPEKFGSLVYTDWECQGSVPHSSPLPLIQVLKHASPWVCPPCTFSMLMKSNFLIILNLHCQANCIYNMHTYSAD